MMIPSRSFFQPGSREENDLEDLRKTMEKQTKDQEHGHNMGNIPIGSMGKTMVNNG